MKVINEQTKQIIFENQDANTCLEWLKNYASEDENAWANLSLLFEELDECQQIEEHLLWMYVEGKARSKHLVGEDYVLQKANLRSLLNKKSNIVSYELFNYRNFDSRKGQLQLYIA